MHNLSQAERSESNANGNKRRKRQRKKFHRELPVRNDVASSDREREREKRCIFGDSRNARSRQSNREENFSSRMSDSTLRSAGELSWHDIPVASSAGDEAVQSSVNEQRANLHCESVPLMIVGSVGTRRCCYCCCCCWCCCCEN